MNRRAREKRRQERVAFMQSLYEARESERLSKKADEKDQAEVPKKTAPKKTATKKTTKKKASSGKKKVEKK